MPADRAPSGPDVARQLAGDFCEALLRDYDAKRNGAETLAESLTPLIARALADARREGEWQPIETAPKDTDVLVVADGMVLFGRYSTAWRGRWFLNGVVLHDYVVTHWMPLPTPPALRQRAAQEATK